MKSWIQLFLCCLTLGSTVYAEPNPVPNVVPAVVEWKGAEGKWSAKGRQVYYATPEVNDISDVAPILARELRDLQVNPDDQLGRAGPGIHLVLDQKFADLGKEGYRIEIGDEVTISAPWRSGLYYGTRTFLQMIRQGGPNFELPKGTIIDKPAYRQRMLMLDVGRKPFPIPVIKDYIRIMAWYKMNELHLHFNDEAFGNGYSAFRLQSDVFPNLAAKDLSYSKQEIRELQDFARERAITITPEFDMPGHSAAFSAAWPELAIPGQPNYLDVRKPETAARLKKLLDEFIPLFDAPDFHIGTDEYRVKASSKEEKDELNKAFFTFVNEMGAYVRSKGKNARVWFGVEHSRGIPALDPNLILDVWNIDDGKSQIAKGHTVINSNEGRGYIVPGAHYYGVSNAGIYNTWEPWMFGRDASKNPDKSDPKLMGAKLHIWNDQGPTGYTHTEIALLSFDSIIACSEKFWGTKGSKNYAEFQPRATLTKPVPGVTVFERLPAANADGLVLEMPGEHTLADEKATVEYPFAKVARGDLEYPWTLTMKVMSTQAPANRGVILSSKLVEICSNFTREEEVKRKDKDGKEVKSVVKKQGIGMVRAAGFMPGDPFSAAKKDDVSRVYGDGLKLNEWVTLTFVGEARKTTLYIDGQKVGQSGDQMICPLMRLGSETGNSFVGKVRDVKVYNKAFSAEEISAMK